MNRDSRGVTLIEAVVGLAIVAFAATGLISAFMTLVEANTRNEIRAGAVTAARQRLELLRLDDPELMSSTDCGDLNGCSAQLFTVGRRQYEVITRLCVRPEWCDAHSRHLTVEVYLDGQRVYDAETVYTQIL